MAYYDFLIRRLQMMPPSLWRLERTIPILCKKNCSTTSALTYFKGLTFSTATIYMFPLNHSLFFVPCCSFYLYVNVLTVPYLLRKRRKAKDTFFHNSTIDTFLKTPLLSIQKRNEHLEVLLILLLPSHLFFIFSEHKGKSKMIVIYIDTY